MQKIWDYIPGIPEIILLIVVAIVFLPLALYTIIANVVDYRLLKSYYTKHKKWDLNICCGNIDLRGTNADVVKRELPNFVLIKDMHKLPFKDKEFENVVCSHTLEHLENPERFYSELKRVGKNVTILIPPLWDIGCMVVFREHKWQFLTLKTKHVNYLPKKFKLPFWWYQKRFGQTVKA